MLYAVIILLYYGVSAYLSYKMAVGRCLPAEIWGVTVTMNVTGIMQPRLSRRLLCGSAFLKLTIDAFRPRQVLVHNLAEWKQWMVVSSGVTDC
jgi:hypothetical protein